MSLFLFDVITRNKQAPLKMLSIDDLIDCWNRIKQHYDIKSVFSDLDVWRQYNQKHSTSEFSLDKIQSILDILVKIDQICIENGSQYQLISNKKT